MNCIKCGSPSEVAETRKDLVHNVLKRRRKCENNHRWTTYEIPASAFAQAKLRCVEVQQSSVRRNGLWTRNQEVLRQFDRGLTAAEVGAAMGLHKATINRIRIQMEKLI